MNQYSIFNSCKAVLPQYTYILSLLPKAYKSISQEVLGGCREKRGQKKGDRLLILMLGSGLILENNKGSGLVFCFYLGQRDQALLFKLCLYEHRQKTRLDPMTLTPWPVRKSSLSPFFSPFFSQLFFQFISQTRNLLDSLFVLFNVI